MSGNDGIAKTLTVATLLCVVCSVIVSASAVVLKPLQIANKDLDRKKNILAAAGLLSESTDIDEAFKQIEIKLVDLDSGEYRTDVDLASFDQRVAAKDPEQSQALSASDDIASIKRRSDIASVYLAKDESGQVIKVILPVSGYGLWSTLHGFLALEPDANTIAGLGFYEHAETPGLGGEVDNPRWKAQWVGKSIYDTEGQPATTMYKGSVTDQVSGHQYKFDALSGATITSRGVENLMRFWAGSKGFGPYLARLKAEGV